MVIDLLHRAPRRLFAAANGLAQPRSRGCFDGRVGAFVRQRRRFAGRQHRDQQVRDFRGGAQPASVAFCRERIGGLVQSRRPGLVDGAERPQQIDAAREVGVHRVEHAHDREILRQRGPPRVDVIAGANQVDQRHARPSGPAQYLHLRFVLASVGAAAVDHVKDAGAVQNGPQQFAFVVEAFVAAVLRDEFAYHIGARTGATIVRVQPRQHLTRALKSRCVEQFVQRHAVEAHRVTACRPGGAGLR